MKNIVIRADASVDIGVGHVMRCIALGQMLKDNGYGIHFITKTDNSNIINRILHENFIIKQLHSEINKIDDAIKVAGYAQDNNIKWIITDGYKFETEYQRSIKYSDLKLCCIDDIANCHYISDIVLNQNLNAENIFKYSCEEYTKLLLGINYVMLRREFQKINNITFSDNCSNGKRLLITIGGSDSNNYSLKILKALKKLHTDYEVKLVIGISYPFYDVLQKFIKDNNYHVEVLQKVNNMVPLYEWAEITLTAGGSTVWELLKMQKHMLTIVVADNQVKISNELHKEKLSYNIGRIAEINEEKLVEILDNCFKDTQVNSEKIREFSKQIGKKMPDTLLNLMEE